MTQAVRLLAYLREHPGASSLEITRDLALVNVTGRVSDLRAAGYRIDAVRVAGVFRYRLIPQPVQLTLTGEEVAVS
jgi:Helix-turn-helix domain